MIVQLPVHTGPSTIEHPLNNTRRMRNIHPERLKHRPCTFIIGQLSFPNKILKTRKDRKSTRLNSSHANISYAVFCLKKKKSSYHFSSSDDNPSALFLDTDLPDVRQSSLCRCAARMQSIRRLSSASLGAHARV